MIGYRRIGRAARLDDNSVKIVNRYCRAVTGFAAA